MSARVVDIMSRHHPPSVTSTSVNVFQDAANLELSRWQTAIIDEFLHRLKDVRAESRMEQLYILAHIPPDFVVPSSATKLLHEAWRTFCNSACSASANDNQLRAVGIVRWFHKSLELRENSPDLLVSYFGNYAAYINACVFAGCRGNQLIVASRTIEHRVFSDCTHLLIAYLPEATSQTRPERARNVFTDAA